MTWFYNGLPVTEVIDDYVGFVYIIENLTNHKKYIGKKLFWFKKTKIVKKKKKRLKEESDWRSYFGSNEKLKQDVELLGQLQFRRTIIRLCKTKGEMSYYEAKEQFLVDALLNEQYYNEWLSLRVRKSHMKI
jgi:Putative endonuclease segE, GIY-YIG domain